MADQVHCDTRRSVDWCRYAASRYGCRLPWSFARILVAVDYCNPELWIRNRLLESGQFEVEHCPPDEIRLITILHMPWVGSIDDSFVAEDTLKRPAISRSNQMLAPVNRVAHRVVKPGHYCRECGIEFRNPAALRLHRRDHHSARKVTK